MQLGFIYWGKELVLNQQQYVYDPLQEARLLGCKA